MSEKIYAVMTETDEDGETFSDILDGLYFTEKDDARRAMIDDFDCTKSDFDECDDIDESHDLDDCALSANMEWSKRWVVVELSRACAEDCE